MGIKVFKKVKSYNEWVADEMYFQQLEVEEEVKEKECFEQTREFAFFILNKHKQFDYLTTNILQIEEALNKVVRRDELIDPYEFDMYEYIRDVYGEVTFEKHIRDWEEHTTKVRIMNLFKGHPDIDLLVF
ncbi:TPA: hypothetical protein ACGW7B_001234 [Bacillus nitratireducens]|uniref:hypothetical protein n=1 Tax=Bacillus cereus group TaxID=86661 RepID=UPI00077877A4|nr:MULTISPECIES: hypothetical protein [Bacillus cereus group]KXY03900.1 hypothetical protein AT271_07790 [Bacillus cereus]ARZ62162.1 hypothetical protein B7P25_10220 [Bacillus thuringiensis]MCC2436644.1 hypothetical protein [Bacillus paranthracis]MCU5079356.1 hypothetical protein [Bacillus cereus]MDG1606586.1 hypothetical protein [Bacillus paranthracis]